MTHRDDLSPELLQNLEELFPGMKIVCAGDLPDDKLPAEVLEQLAKIKENNLQSMAKGLCIDCGAKMPGYPELGEETPNDWSPAPGWTWFEEDGEMCAWQCPACNKAETPKTTEEIVAVLEGLDKENFDVHTIDNAWYSLKALTGALGNVSKEELEKIPAVQCVRVGLKSGMLELHPKGDKIDIKCYCCFGGNPEKGIVPLEQLKEKIEELKDHHCPPWPG